MSRCTRSCFQCPICIGPLAVQSLESAPEPSLLSADGAGGAPVPSGPWILACSYCNWNSAEIGVKFEKPQGISAQLAKLRHGGGAGGAGDELHHHHHHHSHHPSSTHHHRSHHHHQSRFSISGDSSGGGDISPTKTDPIIEAVPETAKARFSALKAFYQAQLAATSPGAGFPSALGGLGMGEYGFNSPGTLSRIMSLYSGAGGGGPGGSGGGPAGRQKGRASTMREAETAAEGLRVSDLDEGVALARLRRDGWDGTVALEQARSQAEESAGVGAGAPTGAGWGPRFTDELWPVPYLLRSKRSKRCPVCRHIISKPESKVGNTRWRIRLVANNYIPSISIRPFSLPGGSGGGGGAHHSVASVTTSVSSSHRGSGGSTNPAAPLAAAGLLKPLQPALFILTFKNPIFEEVRVTLATPSTTPGRFASRVTVLCPQFSIGANIEDLDLDDVLSSSKDASAAAFRGTGGPGATAEGEGSGGGGGGGGGDVGRARRGTGFSTFSLGEDGGPEPGKIWERGRNWVSIVVEVVPASLRGETTDPSAPPPSLAEDEDVLEIPVFVRLEWEGEPSHDQVGGAGGGGGGGARGVGAGDKDGKEKKELAYWCALGVGRISQA